MAKKKKKKEPKVEKVFESKTDEQVEISSEENSQPEEASSNIDDFLGKEEAPEDKLTERQRNKLEKLNNVRNKISKILQAPNIEIVDENFDDEYESGSADSVDGQSQQDYDSLKAMFGAKDKNKATEVTLTIDDFDYTYIGQYLEEYDLMHMKNIKKVKIIRKKSPKLRKFLMIASIVLVAVVGVVLALLFTRKEPVYLKNVTLNQIERTYYFNDKFDYTGLYFIAEYSDGKTEKIQLNASHFNMDLSTRIERVGDSNEELIFSYNNNANLVFTYQGFNVNYAVKVEKKQELGIHALYTKGIFNIEAGGFITNDYLDVYIEYADIGVESVKLSNEFVLVVDGIECVYTKDGYEVEYGTNDGSVIVVKHGEYSITLDKTLNYV